MTGKGQKAAKGFASLRKAPEFMGLILLLIVIILNIITQGAGFFSANNFSMIFSKNTPLILLTMAQSIVILTGNIDLSVGIQMSMVNVLAVMLPTYTGMPIWVAWIVGFLAAVVVSTLNGIIVGYLRIPPMLATYGMSYIIKGINVILMPEPQGSVPQAVWKFYDGTILGLPTTLYLLLIVLGVWTALKRYPAIKEIYALGGSEKNTYATGLDTVKITIRSYFICGIFVGLAGLCLTAMIASGNPISGDVMTLTSVAACLLGGVLISGGWGSMICGMLGALFLAFVTNTVSYLFIKLLPALIPGFQLSNFYQDLISEMIILLGLTLSVLASKKGRRRLKKLVTGKEEDSK